MKTFLCSYRFRGDGYGFEIKADNWTDAENRLSAIKAWGKIDGELGGRIPAVCGSWLPNLVIRVLNLFRGAA